MSVAEIGKRNRFYYWILCGEIPWISNPYHSVYIYIHAYIAPQIQHHILFIGNMYMMVKIKKRKEMFHRFHHTPFQITDFIGTKESENFCTLNILAWNIWWWLYSVLECNLMVI